MFPETQKVPGKNKTATVMIGSFLVGWTLVLVTATGPFISPPLSVHNFIANAETHYESAAVLSVEGMLILKMYGCQVTSAGVIYLMSVDSTGYIGR